jgi:CubicO group peptidase (beta-lactamase class C family)
VTPLLPRFCNGARPVFAMERGVLHARLARQIPSTIGAPTMRAFSEHHFVAALAVVLITGAATLVACTSEGGSAESYSGAAPAAVEELAAREVARPATTGLDPEYIDQAFARAAELPRLHCLLVARHGEIEAESCFRGPGLEGYANVKSVSKSILSAVVGIAISEGYLQGTDQPVLPFFEPYVGASADPRVGQVTIGHLLSMQSGLVRTSGASYGSWVQSSDWVRYVLTRPMISEPGDSRVYSTGNSHLLSAILTGATGQSTWAYARERLAAPLGIELPRWPTDPQGIFFGGNDMRLTPRALVRFGELYRNGGRYEGRQIVPEEWVRESLQPRVRTRWGRNEYSYGWFLAEAGGYPMYYAQGYGGQYIFVVPDLELTVVTTSHPEDPRTPGHNQAITAILRELIVPAAERGARRTEE